MRVWKDHLHIIDVNDPREVEACEGFVKRMVHRALAMEGTCTGEHGVGQGKRNYLVAEHGVADLSLRRLAAGLVTIACWP